MVYSCIYLWPFTYVGQTCPSMKHLNRHVIPLVDTKWYDLGLELLDPEDEKSLDTIEVNNKNDVHSCCRKMFRKWLDTCEDATWNKLIVVLRKIHLNDAASKIEILLQGELIGEFVKLLVRLLM